jgi:hypothetical protein
MMALWLSLAMLQTVWCQSGSLLETNQPSKFFGWNRGIHFYLPSSTESKPQARPPMLYLHDGPNVFGSPEPTAPSVGAVGNRTKPQAN